MAVDVVSCAKMNHISAVCRSSRQAVHKLEELGDNQIDTVNTDIIHSNSRHPGIIAKLKTSSFLNSINVLYRIDTDSNSSKLPFCIFKILFPKSAKSPFVLNQKDVKNT